MRARHSFWTLLLFLAACSADTAGITQGEGQPATGTGQDAGPGSTGGGEDNGSSGSNGSGSSGNGGSGGSGNVDPGDPLLIDQCSAGSSNLSAAQIDALKAGGPAGSARLLYPYDGTVFPRGLEGPLLMWDGTAQVEAVYVHIKSMTFEYHGCLAPTGNNQLQLPQDIWEKAGTKTFGKKDPFSVELTLLSGGKALGPLEQRWTIAQATLKGSIYYNSYMSLSSGIPGGKVFRIPAGKKFEPFVSIECNGCHSVSANGERMTSQTLGTGGRTYAIVGNQAQELARPATTPYAALFPDGSKYLQPSLAADVGRSLLTSGVALATSTDAALYDTNTGMKLTSQGIPTGALMPSFSPDGRLLVFNDNAVNGARGLATVNFDNATNRASNYKVIFQDSNLRPGWPFVLPDNQAVVFVRTDSIDWSGNGAGVFGGITNILAPYSELFMVDLKSGKSTILAKAMGYDSAADAASGKTYLPFGAEDIRHVYFPTVSPVAAGGFFWVFFDAIRHYGNLGSQRQLWGFAIEIAPDGDYSVDRSYPAFYLPGQEFGTGNHRAFTALDPCKDDGDSCTSGVDCCGGYCNFPPDEGEFEVERKGTCSSTPRECSQVDERCESDLDCCEVEAGYAPYSCIAGFCTPVAVL